MKKLLSLLMISTLMGCASTPTPNSTAWQAVSLADTHERVLHSAFTHKDYLIQVATIGKRPTNGYPVVYVLDGNAFFAPSVSVAQMLHGKPNETNPKSLMIVGIGYTTGRQFDIPNRTQDYTPPAMSYPAPKGEQVAFGGAEPFYEFMTQELTPLLDKKFGINTAHRTLLGHSYGGLFGLYTLFYHGASFDNYVIASPSIWWNNKSTLQHKNHLTPTPNLKNILITLGEHELNPTHRNPNTPVITLPESEAYQMSEFLKEKLPNAHVDFKFNMGQTHGMNAYVALMQGLTLAYESCQADSEC